MAVDAVSAAASASQSTSNAAAKAATVDYDAFLKLLVAQLENQDPTNPTDSAEFMAQLASFSNVEQGIKMNTKLDQLLISQALSQVDGLIGKTVTSADGKISGVVKEVQIYTNGAVAKLENGKEILMEAGVKISDGVAEATT
jgi:flagellar basal-body rod modification protein FlgD